MPAGIHTGHVACPALASMRQTRWRRAREGAAGAVMDRRAFLFALGGLVATPLTAGAQHKHTPPTVGLVFSATPVSDISGSRPTSPSARGFLDGLRALGWIDGQNI